MIPMKCAINQDASVSRGCIKDLDDATFEQCQNGEDCEVCLENGCNNQDVITEEIDRYCYVCDSETNPNCISRLDESMMQKCSASKNDLGCFHTIAGILNLIESM